MGRPGIDKDSCGGRRGVGEERTFRGEDGDCGLDKGNFGGVRLRKREGVGGRDGCEGGNGGREGVWMG